VCPDQVRPIYLDHAATTPVDPRVAEVVMHYMAVEFGNAGSRTHIYGTEAAQAVKRAREQVAAVIDVDPAGVVFTSGATEANNLAILGLTHTGKERGRRHIVSTMIEHKAVLEPLEEMERRGFVVTLVKPNSGGWVEPADVLAAVRDDTLLVSVMHVNNETGVIQPLEEIADALTGHDAYFHTDAAQGFGKELSLLRTSRIDLVSISGHKIGAPMGIGALLMRRRKYKFPPLQPLMFGGGQERGLRHGTQPVALIAGLGKAAALAIAEHEERTHKCIAFRQMFMDAIAPLDPHINGDPGRTIPSIVNVSFRGTDSEAVMLLLKSIAAFSNGSACTSDSRQTSHVLRAMALPYERLNSAVRWSWSHRSRQPDRTALTRALRS